MENSIEGMNYLFLLLLYLLFQVYLYYYYLLHAIFTFSGDDTTKVNHKLHTSSIKTQQTHVIKNVFLYWINLTGEYYGI